MKIPSIIDTLHKAYLLYVKCFKVCIIFAIFSRVITEIFIIFNMNLINSLQTMNSIVNYSSIIHIFLLCIFTIVLNVFSNGIILIISKKYLFNHIRLNKNYFLMLVYNFVIYKFLHFFLISILLSIFSFFFQLNNVMLLWIFISFSMLILPLILFNNDINFINILSLNYKLVSKNFYYVLSIGFIILCLILLKANIYYLMMTYNISLVFVKTFSVLFDAILHQFNLILSVITFYKLYK